MGRGCGVGTVVKFHVTLSFRTILLDTWCLILIYSIIHFTHLSGELLKKRERKKEKGREQNRAANSDYLILSIEFIFKMPKFFGHSILHSEASHKHWRCVYSARKSSLIFIIIICERFFILFSFTSLAWYHNFDVSYDFFYLFELQKQNFCDVREPHPWILW